MIDYPQFQLPIVKIALPLGISFYTFQSLSYLIDVYKQPLLVQKNILNLGLYISFFPQLIAGPIVRYHDINYQINERTHSIDLFSQGIERFIIGFSKKVLIANPLAAMADTIMPYPAQLVPFHFLVLGMICYALQIYYDFSGYSDMAIGLGKMFGFNLLENFNYPYAAKTITEFWRRWHISLSSWFKDYLYIPLGGNRKGKMRMTINLFIVFLTTGLWHGAAVNFIFWGLGHGLLLFIEKTWGHKIGSIIKNRKAMVFLGHVYTLVSVVILWVFFRFGIRESFRFLQAMVALNHGSEIFNIFIKSAIDPQFIVCLISAVLFSFPWWKRIKMSNVKNFVFPRYCILIILMILSICSLASGSYNPFIYFRF
jgi:alginate O-acetyltransferase complex protein AlgI